MSYVLKKKDELIRFPIFQELELGNTEKMRPEQQEQKLYRFPKGEPGTLQAKAMSKPESRKSRNLSSAEIAS